MEAAVRQCLAVHMCLVTLLRCWSLERVLCSGALGRVDTINALIRANSSPASHPVIDCSTFLCVTG